MLPSWLIDSAPPLAASDFGSQRVQMWRPEATECAEPLVDIAERPSVHRIQPPLTIGPYRGEAVVPQYFQVLRHRRLSDRELVLNGRTDRTRCQLSVGQQLEDAPADRIAQDIESVHHTTVEGVAYISQGFIRLRA